MPELPEVEIVKLFLAQKIIGFRIESVEVLNSKSFIGNSAPLIGKEIKSVERRAKVLRISFEEVELIIHLKMSGQLIFKGQEKFIGGHPTKDMLSQMPNKSTRVILELVNPRLSTLATSHLYFNDQRKFGWIKVVTGNKLESDKLFEKLGPEPLDKEFTWNVLRNNLLRRKNTPVKVALLDQQILAGVGNIYACEACLLAGIHPCKKIGELKNEDFQKLYKGIIGSLKNGIKYGGSSKTHFINPVGKKGLFLDYAYVYGREKLPCKRCKNLIEKIKLSGRGTYFCPSCQPFDSAQGKLA